MKISRFSGIFDNRVIDATVDGIATTVRNLGGRLRGAQRGAVQENLTVVFAVTAVLIFISLFVFNGFAR
jgi:hypothetical protein